MTTSLLKEVERIRRDHARWRELGHGPCDTCIVLTAFDNLKEAQRLLAALLEIFERGGAVHADDLAAARALLTEEGKE